MKNKVLIALSLASVLSVTAPSISIFAADAAVESSVEAPSAETPSESTSDTARAKHGKRPDTAEGTTEGTETSGKKPGRRSRKPESAEGTTDAAAGESKKHGWHEDVAEPENAIGKDAAKSAALSDAGILAENAGKVRSRVTSLEDGTVIYKVKFTVDSQKYSYKIDAVSGSILDKSTEAVTEEDAKEHKPHGKHGKKSETDTAQTDAAQTETGAAAV